MLWSAFKQTTASIKWRLAPELECFQNLKKLRKQCLSFSPLGNRIQEGKKGWDNLPEVFLSLADCRSKHEMTHWTAGTTWQRVSAQPQTAQTRGNQSLFSMHGLPLKLSSPTPCTMSWPTSYRRTSRSHSDNSPGYIWLQLTEQMRQWWGASIITTHSGITEIEPVKVFAAKSFSDRMASH